MRKTRRREGEGEREREKRKEGGRQGRRESSLGKGGKLGFLAAFSHKLKT